MPMNTENISETEIEFSRIATELIETECEQPEPWEQPEPFEKEVQYQAFPVANLPKVLSDYLKAVCDFVQVDSSMVALPMLSVLSLCLQGKAVVSYPANAHTESINIYTLTIAQPGERKSGVFKALIKPVEEYQQQYNVLHHKEIERYKSKRKFLEHQKQAAMNKTSFESVQKITDELCDLKPVHEMRLICSDTTPEALAAEMDKQNGCMAVMDDEGSVFDVISGLYNNGQGNINLFLKAYDGSSHCIFRRNSDNITLEAPYLTIGIMTQPQQLLRTMNNPQFMGRGLMQRFLFSFPIGKAGNQNFTSNDIPPNIQKAYDELITNLLRIPKADKPVKLNHNKESYNILNGYFDLLQSKMRSGGMFENNTLKEYASKHFGKVLKIAGLLHLCDHTADEPINGKTAMNAVQIGLWAENMALKAFDGGAGYDETTKNAKYILRRIKELNIEEITLRELKRNCKGVHDKEAVNEAIALLEDMNYLKCEKIRNASGQPSTLCYINPLA